MSNPQKQTDGMALLPEVVQAALGAKTFKQATKPIGEDERQLLSRAIKMDVDEWRAEFGSQLREAGSEALKQLREKMGAIKPDALAYTLAVLVDKASALEGRTQLQSATVNVQVNNYGNAGPSKADILAGLSQMTSAHATEPISEKRAIHEAVETAA